MPREVLEEPKAGRQAGRWVCGCAGGQKHGGLCEKPTDAQDPFDRQQDPAAAAAAN